MSSRGATCVFWTVAAVAGISLVLVIASLGWTSTKASNSDLQNQIAFLQAQIDELQNLTYYAALPANQPAPTGYFSISDTFAVGDWYVVNAPDPSPRSDAEAETVGNLIYVMGGAVEGGNLDVTVLSLVEAFNPNTSVWTTKASMNTARAHFAAVSTEGNVASPKIYVFGGRTSSGSTLAAAEVYDVNTNTWSPITPMPVPTSHHDAAPQADGTFLLAGGYDASGVATANSWIYTPGTAGGYYTAAAPLNFARAEIYFGEYTDPSTGLISVFVAGGRGPRYFGNTTTELTTLEQWDPVQKDWVLRVSMPQGRRSYGTGGIMGATGPLYVVIGGAITPLTNPNLTQPLTNVDAFNIASGQWESRAALDLAVYSQGCSEWNEQIFCFGGYTCSNLAGCTTEGTDTNLRVTSQTVNYMEDALVWYSNDDDD